jgi:hypothetical protein
MTSPRARRFEPRHLDHQRTSAGHGATLFTSKKQRLKETRLRALPFVAFCRLHDCSLPAGESERCDSNHRWRRGRDVRRLAYVIAATLLGRSVLPIISHLSASFFAIWRTL